MCMVSTMLTRKSDLVPKSLLVSVFEDDVGWTQDIVHAHDYVLGNRHQWLRGIDMYSFRSNYIFFVRNWCHVFTEGQDQLSCHISFTWMQIGTGMGVHCHWYDSSLLLTPNKSIETFDILELDDISYECVLGKMWARTLARTTWSHAFTLRKPLEKEVSSLLWKEILN